MLKIKKGFTLIELLAVIAILGIVLSVAVVSVNTISFNAKERAYRSLINKIETKAEDFYNDIKIEKFTVQALVDEGYLSTDDGINIYDPRDKSSVLNCTIIEIDLDGYATLLDPKDPNNHNCGFDVKEYTALKIVDQSGNKIKDKDVWYNANNKISSLKPKFEKTSVVNGADKTYLWTTNLAPDLVLRTENYDLSEKNYKNEQIYLTSTVISDGLVSTYKASVLLQIDYINPFVSEIIIKDEGVWTREKEIKITVEDMESGIASYALLKKDEILKSSDWKKVSNKIDDGKKGSIELVITENGEYVIYLEDNAGNITTASLENTFVIDTIDRVNPECVYPDNETEWTNNDREITWGCKDNESGCVDGQEKSELISTTTEKYTIEEYTIKDRAGNETVCAKRVVDVLVDKEDPVCSYEGESTSWTNNDRTVKIKCSDSASGCVETEKVFKYTTTTVTKEESFTIEDNAGNTKDCSKTLDVYVDKESPEISSFSVSSKQSSYNSRNVSVSINASDATSGIVNNGYCLTTSSNSNDCTWINAPTTYTFSGGEGSGKSYTLYLFVKDKAGNIASTSKEYTLYTACQKGNITYSDGSTCSASCGSGTYNRIAYDSNTGSRCPSYDKSSGGSSCTVDCDDDDDDGGGCSWKNIFYSSGTSCSCPPMSCWYCATGWNGPGCYYSICV